MKNLIKTRFLRFVLFAWGICLFLTACEDHLQDIASPPQNSEGIIVSPGDNNLPYIKKVIKKDFPGAKGWRVVWGGGTYTSENAHKVPSIFSTITGAVNSVHYLNNTSPQNTGNADMQIYFGNLKATSQINSLTYNNHTKKTRFKLSGMTVNDLQNAAENNPGLFGLIYEWDFDEPVGTLQTGNYQAGQIYTFKTDRIPAKYGAVRIVSTNPKTIEVVVQK